MSGGRRDRRGGRREENNERLRSRELQRAEEVVQAHLAPLLSCAGLGLKRMERDAAAGVLRLESGPVEPGARSLIVPTLANQADRVAAVEVLLSAALAREGLSPELVNVVFESVAGETGLSDLPSAIRSLALLVARTGRPCALGPMSSYDRRRVHEAVGQVPEVWSRSDGEGILRRLWILPRPSRAESPTI